MLEQFGPPGTFDTDQGSQFTSQAFRCCLQEAGVRVSPAAARRWEVKPNVRLKRGQRGWFGAGAGSQRPLRGLSDTVFKVFARICLRARRADGCLEFERDGLARQVGESRSALGTLPARTGGQGVFSGNARHGDAEGLCLTFGHRGAYCSHACRLGSDRERNGHKQHADPRILGRPSRRFQEDHMVSFTTVRFAGTSLAAGIPEI